jgi:proteasome lid subunit RPN8/RPN11
MWGDIRGSNLVRWNELAPDIAILDVLDLGARLSIIDMTVVIMLSRSQPLVAFLPECRNDIYSHAQALHVEVGGLLLGNAYSLVPTNSSVRPVMISITTSIACNVSESTGVSLRMDTEVWDRARDKAESASLIVVGWYHSHPNLGAFFSGTDRRTQAAFFNHSYSVGLVVDPVRQEEKWFLGANAEELQARQVVQLVL